MTGLPLPSWTLAWKRTMSGLTEEHWSVGMEMYMEEKSQSHPLAMMLATSSARVRTLSSLSVSCRAQQRT